MNNKILLEVGRRIKSLRTERGLSQQELAIMTGYTNRSTIARIERGDIDLTQTKIKLIANALGTTPVELMGYKESNEYENIQQVLAEISYKNSKEDFEFLVLYLELNSIQKEFLIDMLKQILKKEQ